MHLAELSPCNVGRKVTYLPDHTNSNAAHEDCEQGVISSWNDRFVFVLYGRGPAQATIAEKLVFGGADE